MSWDQDKFLQSVMVLVQKHFDGVQKDFNAKIHDRDAISRWKKGDRPSLEMINRIVDEFKCGYDWLLTGKENATSDANHRQAAYPYDLSNKRIHDDVEHVLKFGDGDAVSALSSGLRGVLMIVREKSDMVKALERIEKTLVSINQELRTDPGESGGATLGSGLGRSRRRRDAS